jgi:hypothetical protein
MGAPDTMLSRYFAMCQLDATTCSLISQVEAMRCAGIFTADNPARRRKIVMKAAGK